MTYGVSDYKQVFDKAVEAGHDAMNKSIPNPMVVKSMSGKEHYVSEGMCGFAWVTLRPGNCKFANWLKKHTKFRTAYGGGISFWVNAGGQSIERKEAFAYAMADFIRSGNVDGVKSVYAESRLD